MANDHRVDLETRLSVVIQNTCNTVGCDNCDLKWDDSCTAMDLQGRIHDIELQEMVRDGDYDTTN